MGPRANRLSPSVPPYSRVEVIVLGDCKVCAGEHDVAIHSATLAVHEHIRQRLSRLFEPIPQPKGAAGFELRAALLESCARGSKRGAPHNQAVFVLRLVREAIRYFQTNHFRRCRRTSPSTPAASRYREDGSGTAAAAPLTGNEIPLAVVTETPEIGAPVVGLVTSTLTIDAGSRKSAVTVLPALAWASRVISCSNWYCVPA